jgi:hypothetical protein
MRRRCRQCSFGNPVDDRRARAVMAAGLRHHDHPSRVCDVRGVSRLLGPASVYVAEKPALALEEFDGITRVPMF